MRLTEQEIINKLNSLICNYLPLSLVKTAQETNYNIDVEMEFAIQDGPRFKAAIELLTTATPKAITETINALKNAFAESSLQEIVPMIVAPYIGDKQAELLSNNNISWIDLSGNMLIKIPPSIYIEKTGKPNKFPDTAPIKKIYQGTSSLVSRALLLKPEGFSSLNEIVDFINERNSKITTGTVSKVLKSLEEDLLINRTKSNILVKQPEQLLENLTEGYAEYARSKTENKYKYEIENIDTLCKVLSNSGTDYAYCGFYAARIKGFGMTDQITIFIKSIDDIINISEDNQNLICPNEEFGQLTFIETKNPCVWFNVQGTSNERIVDDLEIYLEMVKDRPRGPKIADQLKQVILGKNNG